MKKIFVILFFVFIRSFAQFQGQTTYCNPMDIGYRYNYEQQNENISYRSGADPVIINHKGEYYLFVTISNGYWHSTDMVNWKFIKPSMWPMEDMCAPAALSVNDTLFLFQSTFEQRPILYFKDPKKGELEFYNRWLPRLPKDIGPWDPALFYDQDTKRWFMYWGSSNVYPIFGAELDPSKKLTYQSNYQAMFWLDPYQHGWERFGPDHSDPFKPFVEGAWMTKHNGKYFLQYGAPGTEYNVYGNGTYVGDSPLGPWEYASYNPISYKPGGFMNGAGHGNTFKDIHGNYWNTGTPWIGYNWGMERRIAMFPAGFDADDQMYANTRFGDFPHYLPKTKWKKSDDLFTGWMLLSYKKPIFASSKKEKFDAEFANDENPRTFWVAANASKGQELTIDLKEKANIKAIQVNLTDHKSTIFSSFDSTVYTQFEILVSQNNKDWIKVVDLSNEKKDRPCGFFELKESVQARYVKYKHIYQKATNLAIADFRVFGNIAKPKPSSPKNLIVERQKDQRNAIISWNKVEGAVGYNIRWGIAKDKLYQTYQFWDDTKPEKFELRALNKGVGYFFAVESFNENGVSELSNIVEIK